MRNILIKARSFYTVLFAVVWVSVLCSTLLVRLREFTTIGTLVNTYFILICLFATWLYLMQTVLPHKALKPLLAVLIVISAIANIFCSQYGIVISPNMIRNALETDPAEAFDLMTLSLFVKVMLFSLLPLLCLKFLPTIKPVHALSLGLLNISLAGILILSAFQPMSSLVRNHRDDIRYLVTPLNVAVSTYKTFAGTKSASANRQRVIVDVHPRMGAPLSQSTRASLTVIVVGETTRSASWQLAGYNRETNPYLSHRALLSFPNVSACGTDTEESLPCMFSRVGRRDYDRSRILSEESLLPLLQRAGVEVTWIDNQSGCKGACQGVKTLDVEDKTSGTDQNLVDALKAQLNTPATSQHRLIVLHMMGSHGPAYFKRYPQQMEFFKPACRSNDFSQCSREEIINAYDNSVRYTDYILDEMIQLLDSRTDIDSSLIYMSDHGESIGEKGLYLHGAPRWMAPNEQTQVPGLLWLSTGMQQQLGTNIDSLKSVADISHDNLFHTVLGLLDIQTSAYDPQWDLTNRTNLFRKKALSHPAS